MKNILEYKGIGVNQLTLKDIDEKKGRVLGYFSIFGNQDADGDIILPGAFKKTLSENSRRIKHLYQHDPFKPLSGTKENRLIVQEDHKGLFFDSTISQTSWGKDTIRLYVDGVLDEHSIGFQTIKDEQKSGYRELVELKLYEGSSVTWGANELAQTTDVKSHFTIESLSQKMNSVMKALRNGNYGDDTFDALELYFKQLQQIFIDFTKPQKEFTPEPVITTHTAEELEIIKRFCSALTE